MVRAIVLAAEVNKGLLSWPFLVSATIIFHLLSLVSFFLIIYFFILPYFFFTVTFFHENSHFYEPFPVQIIGNYCGMYKLSALSISDNKTCGDVLFYFASYTSVSSALCAAAGIMTLCLSILAAIALNYPKLVLTINVFKNRDLKAGEVLPVFDIMKTESCMNSSI